MDESGFTVDAPREKGYGIKGKRCYAKKDWHAKGRVNAIEAITNFKLFNVCLFPNNINVDVFYAWLTKELLPNTPRHCVIVLDNATFHKRKDTLNAVEQAGHTLEFLPPYSPDLNPIEKNGHKPKASDESLGIRPMNFFYKIIYGILFWFSYRYEWELLLLSSAPSASKIFSCFIQYPMATKPTTVNTQFTVLAVHQLSINRNPS